MPSRKAYFLFELKGLLNRRILCIFLLFVILTFYFTNQGIKRYNQSVQNKHHFQTIEKLKVEQYISYLQYGGYGFRLLWVPSPLSILFTHSGAIQELNAKIDSGEQLSIYTPFKGKNLFNQMMGYQDFSGIFLLLGSLFALYVGFDSFYHKGYQQFFLNFLYPKQKFILTHAARLMGLMFFVLGLSSLSILWIWANGISLSSRELIHLCLFLLMLWLFLSFFYSLGCYFSTFRSKLTGLVILISLWFSLIFLIPGVIYTVISGQSTPVESIYNLELKKQEVLMNFERSALQSLKKNGEQNQTHLKRELVEQYWQNEFKKIQKLEQKLEDQLSRNINLIQILSTLTPPSFYLLMGNEISSRGYGSFINFYRYTRSLKEKFVRYYIDKTYHSNFSKVDSFVKKDENLVFTSTRLPIYFGWGAALSFFWCILIMISAYKQYKDYLSQ